MTTPDWKGFAFGNSALFLEQPTGAPYVYLSMQFDNDVFRLAQFISPEAAMQTQAWLEAALTTVGGMNYELVDRLEALRG